MCHVGYSKINIKNGPGILKFELPFFRPTCFWGIITWHDEALFVSAIGWSNIQIARITYNKIHNAQTIVKLKCHYYSIYGSHRFWTLRGIDETQYPTNLEYFFTFCSEPYQNLNVISADPNSRSTLIFLVYHRNRLTAVQHTYTNITEIHKCNKYQTIFSFTDKKPTRIIIAFLSQKSQFEIFHIWQLSVDQVTAL